MLLQDYGAIIIHGICDSPNFLIHHFRRKIKKLKDEGYEEEEIKYDFDEVIKLIRKQVEDNYNKDFATYEKYRDKDRSLPKEKRYNYPKPELDKIPVLIIKYPAYKHDLTGLTKKIYLKDIANVENVLIELFKKDSDINNEDGQKGELSISQIKNNFDYIDTNEVYQHFKVGLVDKKYMSDEELRKYLKAAFDKMTPPKKLFTLADVNSKQKIKKVFNFYYKNVAGKPHGRQKEYAALLGNYFRGYTTENVSTNFSK